MLTTEGSFSNGKSLEFDFFFRLPGVEKVLSDHGISLESEVVP